jgi:L-amino acid N-acyltransferase YncA
VAENSVYVAQCASRREVGRVLLEGLIASAEAAGIWTIQTGIFPEKRGQHGLPEPAGFEIRPAKAAGVDGHWRDVLLLGRRGDAIE